MGITSKKPRWLAKLRVWSSALVQVKINASGLERSVFLAPSCRFRRYQLALSGGLLRGDKDEK